MGLGRHRVRVLEQTRPAQVEEFKVKRRGGHGWVKCRVVSAVWTGFFSGWCRWLVRDPLIPTWTMLGLPTRMRS
jgi:hypothetical protein